MKSVGRKNKQIGLEQRREGGIPRSVEIHQVVAAESGLQ
jgi:hypothetical protein